MTKLILMTAAVSMSGILSCFAQTSNIGKIDNSGMCSFTTVNSSNSTYKILCGGRVLNSEQARQLSEILSVVTKNKLQLSKVVSTLQTLAEQPKNQTLRQICPDGFCNSGSVKAPQTLNDNRQFRSPSPAPPIEFTSTILPAIQRPVITPGMSDSQYRANAEAFEAQSQWHPMIDRPGVQLSVSVRQTFQPSFSRPLREALCRFRDASPERRRGL